MKAVKAVMVLMLVTGCVIGMIWYITNHVIVECFTTNNVNLHNTMTTERKVLRAMENIVSDKVIFIKQPSVNLQYPSTFRPGGFYYPQIKFKKKCKKQKKFNNIHVDKINPKSKHGFVNFKSRVNVNNVKAKSLKLDNTTFFKPTKNGLVIGDSPPPIQKENVTSKDLETQVNNWEVVLG